MHKEKILNDFKSSNQLINDIVKIGETFLINQGIENAKNEIRWYLQKLYKCDSINLLNIKNNPIRDNFLNQVIDFLINRANKIPFQHLLGFAPFYGRNYIINSKALIPRQESEILINVIKNEKKCEVLDIGTGSGCLAITAILEGIANKVDAIDINNDALILAKKNGKSLGAKNISYIEMNILEDIPDKKYDIIISNPPYISSSEYQQLDSEVRDNEPIDSLTDMNDGYTFYNRYAKILNKILKKGGIAIFELSHFFNKEKITSIFKFFPNIKLYKDLNNDIRAIKILND